MVDRIEIRERNIQKKFNWNNEYSQRGGACRQEKTILIGVRPAEKKKEGHEIVKMDLSGTFYRTTQGG